MRYLDKIERYTRSAEARRMEAQLQAYDEKLSYFLARLETSPEVNAFLWRSSLQDVKTAADAVIGWLATQGR